jgi:hypothetical protein
MENIIEDQSDLCITDHMDIMETDIAIMPALETTTLVVTACDGVDSHLTPKGRTTGSIAGNWNSNDLIKMGRG